MKIFTFASVFGLIISSQAALAAGYGEAGCGLGSVVMGPQGNQVMASTTNGTSYTNVFGVTSGTSNCTDESGVRKSSQLPLFIEVNKLALQKESARGDGETIANLAGLMGCQRTALGGAMKSNYKDLFVNSNMNPAQIQNTLQSMVENNPRQNCGT